ncbi:MAG: tetratricopeptide repeat protein, partial [Desulfobacteraceae bacterium]
VQIDTVERNRAMHKDTQNLEAYDYLLRGLEYNRGRSRADSRKARQMFEKAIALDPEFALAYVGLGNYYRRQVGYGWTEFPVQALKRAEELALTALRLDESKAEAYALLGHVHVYFRRYDLAISRLDRAIALNPNDALSYRMRGQILLWSGRVDEALESLERSRRFDPNMQTGLPMFLGIAYYLKGQYRKAIDILEEGTSRRPDWVGNHILLAAAYAESGNQDNARRAAQKILRLQPFFKIENYGTVFKNEADRERIIQGLRKAGLK